MRKALLPSRSGIQPYILLLSCQDVCHCHFTGKIYENCTQNNEIKLDTNLDIKNRHERIIAQTKAAVRHVAKNVSKIYARIDKRLKKIITKKKKRTEKMKSIDNIDKGIIKKNYNIFGIDLTLYKKQLVPKRMINSDDYIENGIANRNHSELIEDTGAFTIPKNDTVEEQRSIIKNENITENVTAIFQNNAVDKTVQKDGMAKNIVNTYITKKNQKYDSSKNVKQRSEMIKDTREFTIPINDAVDEQSSVIKNENVTENVTEIFQINGMDKTVRKDDLPKNVKQRSELIEDTGEFTIPINEIAKEENTIIKNENVTESVTEIFQNAGMNKYLNVQNFDLKKYVEPRNELIEDTAECSIPKNDTVKEKKTITNHTNITENVTKISQTNGKDKYVHNYYFSKNVKQRSELIADTGAFNIPKKDTGEEKSTVIRNENVTASVSEIFQNDGMNKYMNVQNFDLTKNVKQRRKLIEDTGAFTIPKNDTVEKKRTTTNHTNITENVTKIFQNNVMNKNLQKRDISLPDNVVHNYNPEIIQNHNAKNYQKYDFHKKTENYATPKNINPNFNEDKPYNYQNDEMNYQNLINKKDMLKMDKLTRRYDDNVSQNVRPQYQTRLNNDLVKKSLDEFKMVRRKTHYTMPDVEFKTDIDKQDIDYYQDLAHPKFQEFDNEATLNGARNHVKRDHHVEDIRNNMYPTYGGMNHIYNSYEIQNEIVNFQELNNLIARQKQLIEQLAKRQKNGPKSTTRHDFDILMSEVAAKQKIYRKWPNYTDFAFETTTAKTTTKLTTTDKPTTILTLFDETEVRHALKNDPHVKRILKMANLKREKYLNNVRRYLNRRNYTHDTEYAKNLAESANEHGVDAEETTAFVDSV